MGASGNGKMLRIQKTNPSYIIQKCLCKHASTRWQVGEEDGKKESLEALEGLLWDKPSQTAAVLSCEVTRFRGKKADRWRWDASDLMKVKEGNRALRLPSEISATFDPEFKLLFVCWASSHWVKIDGKYLFSFDFLLAMWWDQRVLFLLYFLLFLFLYDNNPYNDFLVQSADNPNVSINLYNSIFGLTMKLFWLSGSCFPRWLKSHFALQLSDNKYQEKKGENKINLALWTAMVAWNQS